MSFALGLNFSNTYFLYQHCITIKICPRDQELNAKRRPNICHEIISQSYRQTTPPFSAEHPTIPAPTEGGWGWVAVVGCIIVHFSCGATDRVYGILLVALRERFPTASATELSSVNGVTVAVLMMTGPVTTIIMNKGVSARRTLILSGFIAATGAVLTAFVKVGNRYVMISPARFSRHHQRSTNNFCQRITIANE